MKLSAAASDLFDPTDLAKLTEGDVPESFWEVVADGWFQDENGALLLRLLSESYFGERGRFRDILGYEAAVNGRGIPDLDIEPGIVGPDRVKLLLRRGVAMAWSALRRLKQDFPDVVVYSYISASPTLMDPNDWTGNLTFASGRTEAADPYLDIEAAPGVVIALDSRDCSRILPPMR